MSLIMGLFLPAADTLFPQSYRRRYCIDVASPNPLHPFANAQARWDLPNRPYLAHPPCFPFATPTVQHSGDLALSLNRSSPL